MLLRCSFRRLSVVLLLLMGTTSAGTAAAQTNNAGTRNGRNRALPHTKAGAPPRVKGILEPVNYKQDVNLLDVVFVTPDVGWVSGEHATILKTSDGGTTWTAQVGGDPSSTEPPIRQLRFLDQSHGWAIQEGSRLLRTIDGQHWDQVNGKFPPGVPVVDYAFTSVDHGILLGGNGDAFYVTNDGGRQWQSVMPCRVSATVKGLVQTQDCHFIELQKLSSRDAYAIARWFSPEAPNDSSIVLFRTADAGEHWNPIVPALRDCCELDSVFTDADHGVILFNTGKTYITADGGKNWHALLSGSVGFKSGPPHLRFADREVGWALGPSPDNSDTYRISFSTDAGHHWTMSRNIAFPVARFADVKFAFPRRDHAYVIGPHGMIYRYRIVPETYTSAHALGAPLMPAVDANQSSAKTERHSP